MLDSCICHVVYMRKVLSRYSRAVRSASSFERPTIRLREALAY
jgi:hypothetical protein